MKKSILYISCFLISAQILFSNLGACAQQNRQMSADTSATQLANDLSISKERAKKIKAAMNYKRQELMKVLKDSVINPAEKQVRFKTLIMERRHQMDSVMTPAEKEKFKQVYNASIQKANEHQANLARKHELEMSRVPHQRGQKSMKTDSVKNKPKTN